MHLQAHWGNSFMLIVIGLQLVAVACGVLALLTIRICRILWDRHAARVKPGYLSWILGELGGSFRTIVVERPHLRKIPYIDRALVRDLILETIVCFTGVERERLAILYQIQSYLVRDKIALRSRWFARRINALARIEVIRPGNAARLIAPLLRDRSPMIRFAALRISIQIDAAAITLRPSDLNELVKRGRFDTALEILWMLAKARNPAFLEILTQHPSIEIRKICLTLLIKERISEGLHFVRSGIPFLAAQVALKPTADSSLLILYIRALAIEASSENEAVLNRVVKHPRPAVRAVCIETLLKIRPDQCAELIVIALNDPSVEVRRIGESEFSDVVRKKSA